MQKLSGESLNIVNENIEKLKALFPEAVSEGRVIWDDLKAELGELIETREERYSFTWNGKAEARRIAQTPSTGTLRPAKEESVDWETTQNLFIEGDNLEVLKLLQKSYHSKVKMIYIDPPYNTGKEFIYPDNFHDNMGTYMEYTGQKDAEGRKFGTNVETSGRYHTNWLNMMYPRLKLARNLLRDDGVIFISIDDNEVHNLRKICDEIFGEGNFVAQFIWEKRTTRENRKVFSFNHDYIVCYTKNKKEFEDVRNMLPLTEEALNRYSNPDDDPRGVWQSVSLNAQAGHGTAAQFYTITTPSGRELNPPPGTCWRVTEKKLQELIKDNRIWFGHDGNNVPRRKVFLSEANDGLTPHTLWKSDEVGTTESAKRELLKLFDGNETFETPKSVSLVQRMAHIATQGDDLILDFFVGSGTTAHAVMKLNAEDGGKRRCISVQLPEPCDEKSEAYKAGYKTIAEISKERIRRARAKTAEEHPDYAGDLGFKVFKLDSSNIKAWDADFDNVEQNLLDAVDNIKSDRTSEDLLYEILLKYGLDLTLPIETKDVAGKTAYIIGLGALVICLDDDITLDTVEAIAALKEEYQPEVIRVVFKDASFINDIVKTNAIQILKQHSIDDVKSV